MKIEIELIECLSTENKWSGWKVTCGDKYADLLGYDEMLGLVAEITMPEKRPTLQWLKTEAQHKAWRERVYSNNMNAADVDFEESLTIIP